MLALLGWTLPCCLIWPSLEALVTEGEDYQGTARMVGLLQHRLVGRRARWRIFSGGWLWEQVSDAMVFTELCIALMVGQLLLHTLARTRTRSEKHLTRRSLPPNPRIQPEASRLATGSTLPPKRFLQMAWLANPVRLRGHQYRRAPSFHSSRRNFNLLADTIWRVLFALVLHARPGFRL